MRSKHGFLGAVRQQAPALGARLRLASKAVKRAKNMHEKKA